MVLKSTAIFLCFPQFRNCLNFLKWWSSSLVSMDVLSLAHTWNTWKWRPHRLRRSQMIMANMGKADKTEVFRVFILFFNKCIHFPCFLSGSWTCLDFSFLPLPAALDCAIFIFFSQNYHSFTSISHSVSMNEKEQPSVKCHFTFVVSGLNLLFAQSVTTLKRY